MDIRTRPRIPVPDEDPYSVAGEELLTGKPSHQFIDFFVTRFWLQWVVRSEGEIKG